MSIPGHMRVGMRCMLLFVAVAAATSGIVDCRTAVVGGGWAGVYAAWRLAVDAAAVDPASLCLFEARSAVGGRTYSVDVPISALGGGQTLTIDIGAYRFGKKMHLPSDLILNVFNLSVVCYEPDCKPDGEFGEVLYRIVDESGRNAGYATPVRAMLADLVAAGVRVLYDHELTGIYDDERRDRTHLGGAAQLGSAQRRAPRPGLRCLCA